MKKFLALFVALCAGLAVSCNTESLPIENANQAGMKAVSITATINDITKTSYTGAGVFSWTAGDEISVLCSDGNFYTFTAASSAASSVFNGMIPEGESIGDKAYFPADAGHTDDSFSLPYYKDISAHTSADIPMVGTKGAGDAYSFVHCAGAAMITIKNIPDGFTAATITVASTHSSDPAYNYKLSGLFYLHADPKWDGAYAVAANENIYSRKVAVVGNTATLYLPCPAGANNWVPNVLNVTGHNGVENVPLVSNKAMGALGTVDRAHIKPIKPLVLSRLGCIDWTDGGIASFAGNGEGSNYGERIMQWKVTSDAAYLYFYYKITKSKIKWGTDSYLDSASTIYIGLDLDNNAATGSTDSWAGMTAEGWESQIQVKPWSGTTEGSPEVIPGDNANSWIEQPVGTTLGTKVSQRCTFDASYAYLELCIPRSALGAMSSTIKVRHEMQWGYYTSAESFSVVDE